MKWGAVKVTNYLTPVCIMDKLYILFDKQPISGNN